MTETLQNAFSLASRLPDADQDRIAAWLIAELDADQRWDTLFRNSQDFLAELGREALHEQERGETKDWPQT